MEKVLVIGSSGFLGRNISDHLSLDENIEVHRTIRDESRVGLNVHYLDLSKPDVISTVLNNVKPTIVINCAGVIGEEAVSDPNINARLTNNLLECLAESALGIKRIIISGSAAEYGRLLLDELPVLEELELRATQGYGLSKVLEEETALKLAKIHHLPVVVVRVFNPIGKNMHYKFLTSNVLRQISEIKNGTKNSIEVSRLDSQRDYVSVEDIASAYKEISLGKPTYDVYNVGSGVSTSNLELINLMLEYSGFKDYPALLETSDIVEPLVASQASIDRMKEDFNWLPQKSLEDVVKTL